MLLGEIHSLIKLLLSTYHLAWGTGDAKLNMIYWDHSLGVSNNELHEGRAKERKLWVITDLQDWLFCVVENRLFHPSFIMYMCRGVVSTESSFLVFHLISTLTLGHSIIYYKWGNNRFKEKSDFFRAIPLGKWLSQDIKFGESDSKVLLLRFAAWYFCCFQG